MSSQIFLQGKILGTEDSLRLKSDDFQGRVLWASLLSDVLPRALLAELQLSRLLLGTGAGKQFLLLLPQEAREQAEEFCIRVNGSLSADTHHSVRLVWAFTENLGSWSDVQKRLLEEITSKANSPAAGHDNAFELVPDASTGAGYEHVVDAVRNGNVAWSPDHPAAIAPEGKHRWELGTPDGIPVARHFALQNQDREPATVQTLGSRSGGLRAWAILLANTDAFEGRLRRAVSVEEYLQLSLMYQQFFAAELQMICSQAQYFRRVSVLYSSGSDCGIYGAWDACLGVAREFQRLFAQFIKANMSDAAGVEGKTISMALELAPDTATPMSVVWGNAKEKLEQAKSAGRDTIFLLGRALEWKQLDEASETRITMARLVKDFGCSPDFLDLLAELYGDSVGATTAGSHRRNDSLDRPWRFYQRLDVLSGKSRSREFERLRSSLISDFTGRRASHVRLRPQGRVALEWAKLETAQ